MTEIYPSQWYDKLHTMGMVYITIMLKIQCKKTWKQWVTVRAGPGQFAALGKILPGAPCLRLVNIN